MGVNFDDLREDGRVVVDFPGRKLAIYTNPAGQVVLLGFDDGYFTCGLLEPEEIDAACAALQRAKTDGAAIQARIGAEYGTFLAIEKARGAAA